MTPHPATLGVVLAGGSARRMGGADKALLELQGQTLLAHVTRRLTPQCTGVILNANGDPARFLEAQLPVVPDVVPGHPGPLAGILSALEWAALHRPAIEWVVSVPSDTPFIPTDLVARLHDARMAAGQAVACAASGFRDHFAIGLWPVGLRHDLRHALVNRGLRRVEDWARAHGLATASWPAEPVDPFFNINRPEDLEAARALASSLPPTQNTGTAMTELDLSGLKCPLPVLRTRKALLAMKPGDQLRVICTDPLAGIDVPNLVREMGDSLVQQRQDEKGFVFVIARAGAPT